MRVLKGQHNLYDAFEPQLTTINSSVVTSDLWIEKLEYLKKQLINFGQTCIAPDYILIKEEFQDQFIKTFSTHVEKVFGKDPSKSKDLASSEFCISVFNEDEL